jgi:hypothetical protein
MFLSLISLIALSITLFKICLLICIYSLFRSNVYVFWSINLIIEVCNIGLPNFYYFSLIYYDLSLIVFDVNVFNPITFFPSLVPFSSCRLHHNALCFEILWSCHICFSYIPSLIITSSVWMNRWLFLFIQVHFIMSYIKTVLSYWLVEVSKKPILVIHFLQECVCMHAYVCVLCGCVETTDVSSISAVVYKKIRD